MLAALENRDQKPALRKDTKLAQVFWKEDISCHIKREKRQIKSWTFLMWIVNSNSKNLTTEIHMEKSAQKLGSDKQSKYDPRALRREAMKRAALHVVSHADKSFAAAQRECGKIGPAQGYDHAYDHSYHHAYDHAYGHAYDHAYGHAYDHAYGHSYYSSLKPAP